MKHHYYSKFAFTLAEVLITLGIIGIVAALTMPTLVTNIRNKGFVEQFKKTYSTISQSTLLVAQELETEPKYWSYSSVDNTDNNANNEKIINLYKKYMKTLDVPACRARGAGCPAVAYNRMYLNGESFNAHESCAYYLVLNNGSTVTITPICGNGGCMKWDFAPNVRIRFIVDVNGTKKPNQVGRDIFYFRLDGQTGNIMPYTKDDTSDCNKDGQGISCAARLIQEGKMNY